MFPTSIKSTNVKLTDSKNPSYPLKSQWVTEYVASQRQQLADSGAFAALGVGEGGADGYPLTEAGKSVAPLEGTGQSVPSGPVKQQLPFSVSALRNACAQGGRGDGDRRELCCENRKCPSVSQQLENSPHAHTKKYYAADLWPPRC